MSNSIKREINPTNEFPNSNVTMNLPPQTQPPPQSKPPPAPPPRHTNLLPESEKCPDNTAVNFFWTIIDEKKFPNLSLPYILKKNGIKYLSVRIIERTILSKYENNYSDEVKEFGSLNSELCTHSDVVLLNEINDEHVNKDYGNEPFTFKDTLVQLDDFLKFYEILSRTCKTKEELRQNNTIRNMTNDHRRIQPIQQQQHINQVQQQKQPQQQHTLNIPDFVFNNSNVTNNPRHISNNNINNSTSSPINLQRPELTTNIIRNEHLNYTQLQKPHQQSFTHDSSLDHRLNNGVLINSLNRNNIDQNSSIMQKQQLAPRTGIVSHPIQNMHQYHETPFQQPLFGHPIHQNSQYISALLQEQPHQQHQRLNNEQVNLNAHKRIGQSDNQANYTNSHLISNGNFNFPKTSSPNLSIEQRLQSRPMQEVNSHLIQKQAQISSHKNSITEPPPPPRPPSWHHQDTNEIFYNNNSIDRSSNSNALNPFSLNERYIKSNNLTSFPHSSIPTSIINEISSGMPMPSSSPQNFTSPSNLLNFNNHTLTNSKPQQPVQKQVYQHQNNKAPNPSNQHIIQALSNGNYTPSQINEFYARSSTNTVSNQLLSSQGLHQSNQQKINHSLPYLTNNLNSHSISSINNGSNQILNSPTPPLTPTPSNFVINSMLASSPSAGQPQLLNRTPNLNFNQNNLNNSETNMNVSSLSKDINIERSKQIRNSLELSKGGKTSQVFVQQIKNQPSVSSFNNSTNEHDDDDDDCIILDDQPDKEISPKIPRRLSNPVNSKSAVELPAVGVSLNENLHSGFIQLNNIIVPYIRLSKLPYRCCTHYQPSYTYIPLKILFASGLISKDSENFQQSKFETIHSIEKKKNPNEFMKICELIEILDPKHIDSDKITVINILDLFSHFNEALFLKQHKIGKQIIEYKEILRMTGGVVLLDIIEGPRDLLIFPFVKYNDMYLAPYNTFNNYIKNLDSTKVDYSNESLSKEIYNGSSQDIPAIRQFLNLLLFYLTDNERKCKLPTTVRLINIKPWLNKYPDEFKILCKYTPNFPSDWITDIEKCLVKFKSVSKQLPAEVSENHLNDKESPVIDTSNRSKKATCLTSSSTAVVLPDQIETVSLSPSSMDSVTPSVSPFSNSNQINSNTALESTQYQPSVINYLDQIKARNNNNSPVETLQTSAVDSNLTTSGVDQNKCEISFEPKISNDICIDTPKPSEKADKTVNENIDIQNCDDLISEDLMICSPLRINEITEQENLFKQIETFGNAVKIPDLISQEIEETKNTSCLESNNNTILNNINADRQVSSEPILINNISDKNSQPESNIEFIEEIHATNEEESNAPKEKFDFDEHIIPSSYDIFKQKRRLSDSVVFYNAHSKFYTKFLTDEKKNFAREGKFDKKLDAKLDEINNNIFAMTSVVPNLEIIIQPISSNRLFKMEPFSPLTRENNEHKNLETSFQIDVDLMASLESETHTKKRQNAFSSSNFSKRKKSDESVLISVTKYDCLNDENIEAIDSDSDVQSNISEEQLQKNKTINFDKNNNNDNENNLNENNEENKTKEDKNQIQSTSLRKSARKSTSFKPKQIFDDTDLYSAEDFDEDYYLKKFNIQECCVVLENVCFDKFSSKKRMTLSSDSNTSIESKNSKKGDSAENLKTNSNSKNVSSVENCLVGQSNTTIASNTIHTTGNTSNTTISSLLQPLNCNQKNIKQYFSNVTIKHKENKNVSK